MNAGLFQDIFNCAHEVDLAIPKAIKLVNQLFLYYLCVEFGVCATQRLEMAVDVKEFWHEFHEEYLKSVDLATINK